MATKIPKELGAYGFVLWGIISIFMSFAILGGPPIFLDGLLLFWVAYRFNKTGKLEMKDKLVIAGWFGIVILYFLLEIWLSIIIQPYV